jgi:hypothetical protein
LYEAACRRDIARRSRAKGWVRKRWPSFADGGWRCVDYVPGSGLMQSVTPGVAQWEVISLHLFLRGLDSPSEEVRLQILQHDEGDRRRDGCRPSPTGTTLTKPIALERVEELFGLMNGPAS